MGERPEIDRWILSELNTLVKNVDACYEDYEPTKAGRLIQDFVIDNVSNWFVRLSRKRFWGSAMGTDKLSAYQTLYTCLETVAKLMAPIAPYYADRLYHDLTAATGRAEAKSVHLATFPVATTQRWTRHWSTVWNWRNRLRPWSCPCARKNGLSCANLAVHFHTVGRHGTS